MRNIQVVRDAIRVVCWNFPGDERFQIRNHFCGHVVVVRRDPGDRHFLCLICNFTDRSIGKLVGVWSIRQTMQTYHLCAFSILGKDNCMFAREERFC